VFGATLMALGWAVAPPVEAAPRTISFNIPAQRVSTALLELGLQAQLSLGGEVAACRGRSPRIVGSMTLDAALTRLLQGSGCAFTIRRDGAVIVRSAPPPRPASHPSIPPPPEPAVDIVSQVSDVVVTGGRRPEFPLRSPTAITAVTGAQVRDAGIEDVNGLAGLVSGMTVTNLGPGRNKIFLRGLSDGAFTGLTQSTVALYLDFVPVTYNAPDPDLKLIDIDRVEVLRGPQGTLYGTGPIGGVVRMVTRRPSFDLPSLALDATGSITESGGLNTDLSVIANKPLFDDRVAVRADVYRETFSGYVDDLNLGRNVNSGQRDGARLAVSARINPDWTLTGGLVHQSINTDDTHYGQRQNGALKRRNLVREPHDNDFDELYATIEGGGSWGRVVASVAEVSHHFDSRYDASAALPAFGSTGRTGALDESKAIDLFVAELTVSSPQDRRLRWLAGGFASTSTTTSSTLLSQLTPTRAEIYDEDRADTLNDIAAFGEIVFDLTDRLTATAGVRYFNFDYDVDSTVGQAGTERRFAASDTASGFSPKLGLAYRLGEQINLYAQVSQGYRAGGFNTAGPIGQVFDGGPGSPAREYLPDELWNYEIGAKSSFLDGRATARIALFHSTWSDIQSDQFLPSGLAYAVNVGNGANDGVEVEAAWQVTDDWALRGNAVLDDPQITTPSPDFDSRGDSGLPGVPGFSANIALQYRKALDKGFTLSGNANLTYVGASRLTFSGEDRYRMGDYATGRIALGLSRDDWSITAFVDNPLDSRANTFSFGDPFRLADAAAVTPLRPRTVGLSVNIFR